MKIYRYILPLLMFALASVGCSDLDKTTVAEKADRVAPTLKNHDAIVISQENEDSETIFEWTAADYGYSASVEYTLWAKQPDSEESVRIAMSTTNKADVQLKAINNAALSMGIEPSESENLTFYLTSTISESFEEGKMTSNDIVVAVTPFEAEQGFWSLVGSHQGWSPDDPNIPRVYQTLREKGNPTYEGIADLTTGGDALQFKFIDGTSWGDPEWASPEGGQASPLAPSGDNIEALQEGYYFIKLVEESDERAVVNYTKFETIGVIGDCFEEAPGWSGTVDMTYNAAERAWQVTTTITGGGEFKVRADDGKWSGDSGSGFDEIYWTEGGDNIKMDASYAGLKVISLHTDSYPFYITITEP